MIIFFILAFSIFIFINATLLIVNNNNIARFIIVNFIISNISCLICLISLLQLTTNYIDIVFFYILLSCGGTLALWIFYKNLLPR